MAQVGIENNEDLSGTGLGRADQAELFAAQTECTFVFSGAEGWPAGVVMSFMLANGRFWLTSAEGRAQTRAVEADPRVSLIISNAGTALPGRRMIAIRGRCRLHRDAETKAWFYPCFAARLTPGEEAAFLRLLDSPNRVIFEVEPIMVALSHDSRKMAGDGRGGKAPPQS